MPKPKAPVTDVISLTSATTTYDEIAFTYDSDGDITNIAFKASGVTVFTLTFNYDVDKNLISIVRG